MVRNPYDNLATIILRAKQKGITIDEVFFQSRFNYFRKHALANQKLINRYPNKILTIYHEHLIEDSQTVIESLIGFLGIEQSDDFIEKASKKINNAPHQTRFEIDWPASIKLQVEQLINEISFFQNYAWNS